MAQVNRAFTSERNTETRLAADAAQQPLLQVEDLHVHFVTSRGVVRAVEGLSYQVRRGEMVAVVGESGCGKSVSALALMQLLPKPTAQIVSGRITFDSRDLLKLSEEEMREIRGRDIAMVFQEPMTSLNPVLSIGLQLMEPLFVHFRMEREKARARAIELLGLVGIPDPESRLDHYPHQLSGGMRQRVMIAIGLACNPKLIIADEPTTALDVTIQAQILELMKELSHRLGIAMVVITHNLGIVARYADYVYVMYAAHVAEKGTAEDIFKRPCHPYAMGLLKAVPRLDQPPATRLQTIEGLPPNLMNPPTGCRFAPRCPVRGEICEAEPPLAHVAGQHWSACHRFGEITDGRLAVWMESTPTSTVKPPASRRDPVGDGSEGSLCVTNVVKHFPVGGGFFKPKVIVRAVEDLSFAIRQGETLGLVGESGCGKTTVGRLILGLDETTAGDIEFEGRSLSHSSRAEQRRARRRLQVIFQDPYSSLNPRMTIGQIIAEPIRVYKLKHGRAAIDRRVQELLSLVGLYDYMAERYPHELSGGQRQRVGIARALALEPNFIVCDEAVSALDVSIQAQIINLLEDLQKQLSLTYLFIAHDLAVVRHISNRVAVMYLGRIMELADRDDLFENPKHPYTIALLNAAPVPDPEAEKARPRQVLKGELPSPLNVPSGCVFNTRCPHATEACRQAVPPLREIAPGHYAACVHL